MMVCFATEKDESSGTQLKLESQRTRNLVTETTGVSMDHRTLHSFSRIRALHEHDCALRRNREVSHQCSSQINVLRPITRL